MVFSFQLNRRRRDVKDIKEVKKEAKKEAAGRPQDLDKSESRLEFQTSYPEVPPRPRKQQPPSQQQQQQQQQQRPKRRTQPEASFQAVVQRPPETISSTPKGCTA
jgi:Skp family chaperone for outer membrane proteins